MSSVLFFGMIDPVMSGRTSADMQHPALSGDPPGRTPVPFGQRTPETALQSPMITGRIRLSEYGCVPARMTALMEARHLCLSPRLMF